MQQVRNAAGRASLVTVCDCCSSSTATTCRKTLVPYPIFTPACSSQSRSILCVDNVAVLDVIVEGMAAEDLNILSILTAL